jgi:hypothetical protein
MCSRLALIVIVSNLLLMCHALGPPGAAAGESEQVAAAREVLERLKSTRIISIQDHDKINGIDQEGMAGVWGDSPINDYDRDYRQRLKELLGVELILVRSPELLAEMEKVSSDDAERLADLWIDEAVEVKHVKRSDIIRPAYLYYAFKELLRKYDAQAVTYDSATLTLRPQIVKAWTPLAILELSKEQIPCCCQSHIDCLVTQTIGSMLTDGRQGFVGDVLNDWAFSPIGDRPRDVIVIGHCGAPVTMLPDRRIPYLIRDHIHSHVEWFGPDDVPTGTTLFWPTNEPATVVKFDVFRKKVSIFTGKVLDGDLLYEDFANQICRNKMVVQLDHPDRCYLLPSDPNEGAFRNWWGSWGCHQVVFYGDLTGPLREFATLAGFEVVEAR